MNNTKVIGLRSSRDNWFTCVDTEVISDTELAPEARFLFAVLCMTAGFGERTCSISDEELSELTGHPVDFLPIIYRDLEARGVIIRDGHNFTLIGHNAPCYSEEDA